MVLFLILLFLVICKDAKIVFANGFNWDYLEKKNTTAVNGIFVILVVFSHFSQYAVMQGPLDCPYLAFQEHLNQLVVGSFWFYSGFGMMEAIRRTDGQYIDKLPIKFWRLLLRFDVAVLIFWLLNAALGRIYTGKELLLALTAWGDVGNSNWYIFAMLIEYLLMYIAFKVGTVISKEKGRKLGLLLMIALTLAFVFVLMKAGKPGYAYNTIIILPFGAFYSEYRKEIENIVMSSDLRYLLSFAVVMAIYVISFIYRWDYGIEGYTIWALAFVSALILLTMKIRIYNTILEWFGMHIFSIYILQRIPMIILDHIGLIASHKYISLIIVIAVTIPMALVFEKFADLLINKIEAAFSPNKGIA